MQVSAVPVPAASETKESGGSRGFVFQFCLMSSQVNMLARRDDDVHSESLAGLSCFTTAAGSGIFPGSCPAALKQRPIRDLGQAAGRDRRRRPQHCFVSFAWVVIVR